MAIRGRLVVIGGISGYQKEGFPEVSIPNLPTQVRIRLEFIFL